MMKKTGLATLAVVASLTTAAPAMAQLTTYIGSDNNATSTATMPNSIAASAAYSAAAPGASLYNFESAIPSGLSISSGSITSNSGCGTLCGFNTSPGGSSFLSLVGGTTTFSFASPINTFGFYITGLQTNLVPQQTVTFSDGSSRVINLPSAINGGAAFVGFTDFGASIASVTLNVTNDIVAVDDLRFGQIRGTGAVPEPASWALMIVGFGAVGGAMRSRRRSTRVAFAA